MELSLIGFLALFCIVAYSFWVKLQELQVSIATLPALQPNVKVSMGDNHVVNQYIENYHPLPVHMKGTRSVVMLGTPNCPSCQTTLELFVKTFENRQFPFECWMLDADMDYFNKFAAKYGQLVPVQAVPQDLRDRLNITALPVFLVLDPGGVIIDAVPFPIALKKHFVQ